MNRKRSNCFLPRLGITINEIPSLAEEIIAANLDLIKNTGDKDDVLEWFFREDDHPLSFSSLCESLRAVYGEYDPEVIRSFLRKHYPLPEKKTHASSQPGAGQRSAH